LRSPLFRSARRSALAKVALLLLVLGTVTGVGAMPGCGGGYDDDCYCEWVYDPLCNCYVESCYYCKSTAEKQVALPAPPEPGYRVEVQGDRIVAVPDGW
jgi:hypothetical protein